MPRLTIPLDTFASHSKLRETLVSCWFSFDRFCFAGSSQVPQAKTTRYAVLFAVSIISLTYAGLPPSAHAVPQYSLTPLPFITQEGYSILLILNVVGASPSTLYQFSFHVRDPSTKVWNSVLENYTTFSGQTQFSLLPSYPSAAFIGIGGGTSSLVGQYVGWVNQTRPALATNTAVAVTTNGFFFILTDNTEYQRTDTVGIRATGYNSLEPATVIIRTQTSSTVVLNATTAASPTGIITVSWKIPRNAIIDNYLVTITGKATAKNPPDAQGFVIRAAKMSISTFTSSRTSYERTETMKFSFKSSYPDGQNANSGTALVVLTSPGGTSVSLTAVYDSVAQTFNATYKTFFDNQTGIWTASLGVNGFDDGFGNTGPTTSVSTSPQLQPAVLTVTITSKSYFAIGEQIKFNATIEYPDLTNLTAQSGQASAFLLFSGGGHNDTIAQFVFDSTLNFWVGTYTPGNEPGGLWSLTVSGADSTSPANSGKATKTIQLQDRIPTASYTFTSGILLTSAAITFNGTASFDPDGTIVSYAWVFGDGSTGTGATPSHSYSIAGNYVVKPNITDNSGSTAVSTQTITIMDKASSNVSLPLYYFGILAALIAALLIGAFLALRRHKVTHARLKIDLEAVRAEAGRIENQEFFQSVKDQLKKDKE